MFQFKSFLPRDDFNRDFRSIRHCNFNQQIKSFPSRFSFNLNVDRAENVRSRNHDKNFESANESLESNSLRRLCCNVRTIYHGYVNGFPKARNKELGSL